MEDSERLGTECANRAPGVRNSFFSLARMAQFHVGVRSNADDSAHDTCIIIPGVA